MYLSIDHAAPATGLGRRVHLVACALPPTVAIDTLRGNNLQDMNQGPLALPFGIRLAWLVVPSTILLRIFFWKEGIRP